MPEMAAVHDKTGAKECGGRVIAGYSVRVADAVISAQTSMGAKHGVLELRNVTRRFGELVAVDDVSLSIKAGEFFTLLAPSGSGKTTILCIDIQQLLSISKDRDGDSHRKNI